MIKRFMNALAPIKSDHREGIAFPVFNGLEEGYCMVNTHNVYRIGRINEHQGPKKPKESKIEMNPFHCFFGILR
jgi:hypothetical protein